MSIGYACLVVGIRGTGLSHCVLKNATEDNLRKVIVANLTALEALIDYNSKQGIKLFRISSDIIPFGSHEINKISWWDDYKITFLRIGNKITQAGIRVSMHPGQYTVLNSSSPNVVEKAIAELSYHAKFLNALGMNNTCKLVLHIGGVYGNKEIALKAFIDNYFLLPQNVKKRLVLENDDKNYTIHDVLSISKETGAPVIFDNLHHKLNPSMEQLSEFEWIDECKKTWKMEDGKQKIHYSQQKEGTTAGAHSEYIALNPFIGFFKELPDKDIDIMLEVKDKNLSAMKCINTVVLDASGKRLEAEWARYKYLVLGSSAKIYNDIRQLLKNKSAHVAKEFYEMVEEALNLPEDKGAQVNSAEHVWGYVSKDSSPVERKRYNKLLDGYMNNTSTLSSLKNHLLKCAEKREIEYLLNSLYFYINK